ncbi:MAG TPA: hypothetical protein VND19_15170 [Acetobacteraceae bacterium]|nr:hypothetical protein [Acetobacteraceae bacterium]
MSDTTKHRLAGLEPDNLLAFLALLGALRALDTARPEWRARAYWDVGTPPLRPVLTLAVPQTGDAVATAAAEGAATLARSHRFERNDLNYPRPEARDLLTEEQGEQRSELLDALMSDGATREDESIWPTPLCFLFGQGHQHFLARLVDIPAGRLPAKLAKTRRPPDLNAPDFIARTLFAPWTRNDPTDGLRWDPAEDRRYALRADDPSGDPAGMQHGANRLAAVGLPVLSGAVVRRRGETRFLNVATSYGGEGGIRITWPIWTVPARLHGIRSLLAHPALAGDAKEIGKLAAQGVAFAFRAQRISVGKFFNVTLAQRVG